MSDESGEFRPTISMIQRLTKADLRGCERLRDRIRFDLYVAPDTPNTRAWCDRQRIALAVIEERIAHGR